MRDHSTKFGIFKQQAYIIIYGTNTLAGKLFDLCLLVFILASTLLVMLETVENIDTRFHTALVVLEWSITTFFTLEYILRIISNQRPWRYIFSFYGIIDLLALLPMYLSFFIPGSKMLATVRVLRLLRIFRILSLAKFRGEANALVKALKASRAKIFIFIYFVLVSCVLLGTVMYMIEGREHGFSSIPHSIYWCIVTLTTVGYGDIAPSTPLGQTIASAIMILGYGVIAVPTGIVSAEYKSAHQSAAGHHAAHEEPEADHLKEHVVSSHVVHHVTYYRKVCPSCGEMHLPACAAFCHKCGQSLKKEEEPEQKTK